MRTTIDIPTPLFKRAKAAAAEQGTTLRAVIVRALEAHLAAPATARPYKFEWEGVSLGKLSEGEWWDIMRDQDRRWWKDYLKEQEQRKVRKKR